MMNSGNRKSNSPNILEKGIYRVEYKYFYIYGSEDATPEAVSSESIEIINSTTEKEFNKSTKKYLKNTYSLDYVAISEITRLGDLFPYEDGLFIFAMGYSRISDGE